MTYPEPKGWHWYNEAKTPQPHPKKLHRKIPTFSTASDALAFQQKVIHEAKAQAVIDPTPEHIRLYRYIQEFIFQKVAQFAKNWQKVSLTDPTLDFVATHPTASAAQPLLHQAIAAHQKNIIDQLKRMFMLTYIYKKRDPLEADFELTVKRFAIENDWPLKEINLDDATLLQQTGAQAMTKWLHTLHLSKTPAVLLVNPHTRQTFPLTFGYIAESELKKRCGIWLSEIQADARGE
jgi:conjugal transfer pilus assembly protein TraF